MFSKVFSEHAHKTIKSNYSPDIFELEDIPESSFSVHYKLQE